MSATTLLALLLAPHFTATGTTVRKLTPTGDDSAPTDSNVSFELFTQECLEMESGKTTGGTGMKEVKEAFEEVVRCGEKWDTLTFTDETGGSQIVPTVKVIAMLGDLNCIEYLIESSSDNHVAAINGARTGMKHDVAQMLLSHPALHLDESVGLACLFVTACQALDNARYLQRLIKRPGCVQQLRSLCPVPSPVDASLAGMGFGEGTRHMTVLEHGLMEAATVFADMEKENHRMIHGIKAHWQPIIRDAECTAVDFRVAEFEEAMRGEMREYEARVKVALECCGIVLMDVCKMQTMELRRVFDHALRLGVDEFIQQMLQVRQASSAARGGIHERRGERTGSIQSAENDALPSPLVLLSSLSRSPSLHL